MVNNKPKPVYVREIESVLEYQAEEGYLNGLTDGLAPAEKISVWLTCNPPMPHSTLKELLDREIIILKSKVEFLRKQVDEDRKRREARLF